MKRMLALLLCALLLSSCAMAETDLSGYAIANGVVSAVDYVDVTAPYSGTLRPFDLESGDHVRAGDALFTMMTSTIYASEDGVVEHIFAKPSDDAGALTARYGGLVALEPAHPMQISASIMGGYNSAENKYIHVGETLYFRSAQGDHERGHGMVTLVRGDSYVVDILEGEFKLGEQLTLYRDDDYSQKECVGKGNVMRRDPVLCAGQGRVGKILVSVGDEVKAGSPLLTLLGLDAEPDASPVISAPAKAVAASVAVAAGQQVWKGQVLARLFLTDALEVVAEVDEVDLNGLRVGDSVYVTLDTDDDNVLTGTVTEISGMGATRQNAAYYTVHVSLQAPSALLGGSASVYLPRK